MRFVFIVDSLAHGGAGRVVSIIASGIQARGNDVSIILMSQVDLHDTNYRCNEKIRIIAIKSYYGNNHITPMKRTVILRRVLKKINPDYVIAFINEYVEYSVLASLICDWKVIGAERVDPHIDPKNRILRLLRNPLYSLSDGLVFQTQEMKDYFPKRIRDKSVIILNPLTENINEYKVDNNNKENRIVSVGRITPQKNYEIAIEAMQEFLIRHPDYIYEIYGDGPDYKSIQNEINKRKMKDRIFLRGHSENVIDDIFRAKVFLMTSNYEGLSNALIEAMALGIPCISTDHPIGDAKMLFNKYKGHILVEMNNKKQIISALERTIYSHDNCVIKSAYKIREDLNSDTIVEQWIDFCHSL